jgi:hypothetical protein
MIRHDPAGERCSRLPSPYAPSPRTDTMMALALAAAGPILAPVDQARAPR